MVAAISSENKTTVAGLLRALEGLRNTRAILILLGAAVTAILLVAILSVPASTGTSLQIALAILGLVCAFLTLAVGASAAGGVLMDAARGVRQRSIADAVITGAGDFLKLIVIGILAGLFYAAYLLLLAAILFVCKIPGIGPVLYAVLFPVLVVSSAMIVIGLGVGLTIAGPAMWEGNGVRGTIARVMSIAATRLPEVLVGVMLLYLLMFVLAAIVWMFISTGIVVVAVQSASILGADITSSVSGLFYGLGGNAGGGYVYAGLFGGGILLAVVLAALLSVFTMGMNLIYLQATAGLNTQSMEKSLAEGLEHARHKASEIQERAKRSVQEAHERARQATAQRSAALVSQPDDDEKRIAGSTVARCSACGARISEGDAFCGGCGQRLT